VVVVGVGRAKPFKRESHIVYIVYALYIMRVVRGESPACRANEKSANFKSLPQYTCTR